MQGTPAHLEYIGPEGRKRRKNCGYYIDGNCYYSKAQTYMLKCVGRLCCSHYDDSDDTKVLMKEKREHVNHELKLNDDNHKKITNHENTKINNVNIKNNSITSNEKKHHPLLNKTILLQSQVNKKELTIRIVNEEMVNQFQHLYSQKSKLALALINKTVGDIIHVTMGNNHLAYKILAIK